MKTNLLIKTILVLF